MFIVQLRTCYTATAACAVEAERAGLVPEMHNAKQKIEKRGTVLSVKMCSSKLDRRVHSFQMLNVTKFLKPYLHQGNRKHAIGNFLSPCHLTQCVHDLVECNTRLLRQVFRTNCKFKKRKRWCVLMVDEIKSRIIIIYNPILMDQPLSLRDYNMIASM